MPAFGANVFAAQTEHGRFDKLVWYLPGWHKTHISEVTSGEMHASRHNRRIVMFATAFI